MTLNKRINHAVESVGAICAAVSSLAAAWILFYAPLWWLLPLIGISFMAYYVILLTVGFIIGARYSHEKWAAEATSEALEKTPEDPHLIGAVINRGEVIGRYMDHNIHEWIEIKTATGIKRFNFLGGAPFDRAGNMLLPREDGFACLDTCLYEIVKESSQPEITS
jgi:hypothetical protein